MKYMSYFQKIKTELDKRKQAQQSLRNDSNDNLLNGDPHRIMDENAILNDPLQNPLQSMVANICIFVGFAAFAYTVKYVLRSISTD